MPAPGYREHNSTADRALRVLELFTPDRPLRSAAEISDALGVAPSTAYRYLNTLLVGEYLASAEGGGYRLGPQILRLARVARQGFRIGDAARPLLEGLVRRFGQTALLTQRVGDSIVCIERAEPAEQRLRISYEPGTVLPINAGASAHVLLAGLDPSHVRRMVAGQPLHAFTARTLVDAETLEARLAQIRADGYDIGQGEVDPDVLGIAVPVFGRSSVAVAAVSVVGMAARIPDAERTGILGALQGVARDLGEAAMLHEA